MRASRFRIAMAVAVAAAMAGCAGVQVVNEPLESVDPSYGYRPRNTLKARSEGGVLLGLAFSGGGTRAAAFAYGVLEELRDTLVTVDGQPLRLLDEVDTISAVSGGTFPAAYYGLFGDRIFEDFEDKFLNRNIQRALVLQALRPFNLLRLFTPFYTRSIMASQYYNRKVFERATFADLQAAGGPHVNINATDLSGGYRFTFGQGQFDLICSDLGKLPVAKAVAASSAVPVLLTPITLRNYAGTCGFEVPDWLEEGLRARRTDLRRYQSARSFGAYLDADDKKYIHLVDGGISDNLGLRLTIDLGSAVGMDRARRKMGIEMPPHWVIIVVNAETDPDPTIDLSAASPSFAGLMSAVSASQIRRYNLETLMLVRDAIQKWAGELTTSAGEKVTPYLIEVSFDAIENEERRSALKLIPTSFTLKNREVEELRRAGRRLLRESPSFQKLLKELR